MHNINVIKCYANVKYMLTLCTNNGTVKVTFR